MDGMKKVPVREQEPKVRATNFEEVCYGYNEEEATKILSQSEVTAIADVKMGCASATAWGCDLTHEYVNINADYRS